MTSCLLLPRSRDVLRGVPEAWLLLGLPERAWEPSVRRQRRRCAVRTARGGEADTLLNFKKYGLGSAGNASDLVGFEAAPRVF